MFLLSVVVLFTCQHGLSDGMMAPWGTDSSLLMAHKHGVIKTDSVTSYSSELCYGWLYFYQKNMSVVVRSHCPLEPSCSNYSIEAIRKHGALMGVVLTCDRLFHEADEARRAQRVWVDGRWKGLDMVADNDFWWHGGGTKR